MMADFDDHLTAGVPVRRVAAWLIDMLILGAILWASWFVLAAIGFATFGLGFPLLAILPVIPFLYHAGFLAGRRAATPGMRLLGIIARRNLDLTAPTLLEALIFTVGLYLTLAAGAIWLLVALVTRRRRALHDMLAGLTIVRTRALTAGARYGTMPAGPWIA